MVGGMRDFCACKEASLPRSKLHRLRFPCILGSKDLKSLNTVQFPSWSLKRPTKEFFQVQNLHVVAKKGRNDIKSRVRSRLSTRLSITPASSLHLLRCAVPALQECQVAFSYSTYLRCLSALPQHSSGVRQLSSQYKSNSRYSSSSSLMNGKQSDIIQAICENEYPLQTAE